MSQVASKLIVPLTTGEVCQKLSDKTFAIKMPLRTTHQNSMTMPLVQTLSHAQAAAQPQSPERGKYYSYLCFPCDTFFNQCILSLFKDLKVYDSWSNGIEITSTPTSTLPTLFGIFEKTVSKKRKQL